MALVSRTMTGPLPKHILVSGAYEYSMLHNKKELRLQKIKITNQLTLKQDYLDYQDEPSVITGVFYMWVRKAWQSGSKWRDDKKWRLALKMKDEETTGCGLAPKARKGKETGSSPELLEKSTVLRTPWFLPGENLLGLLTCVFLSHSACGNLLEEQCETKTDLDTGSAAVTNVDVPLELSNVQRLKNLRTIRRA